MDASERTPRGQTRIAAIDGLRGAMIAYIVLHHISHMAPVGVLRVALEVGGAAVDVFFLLSGFVLMLSFLRRGSSFENGVAAFLGRRLLRLLPLYYIGLALSFFVAASLPFHIEFEGPFPHAEPTTTAWIAHLLAIQNFFPSVLKTFNGNYWFFAVEIQLSLLFPFLALAWNRWGRNAVLIACLLLAIAGAVAFEPTYYAKPQFILLFAMGMATAEAWLATERAPVSWPLAWWASLATGFCAYAMQWFYDGRSDGFLVLASDLSVGVLAASTVMACRVPRGTFPARVLELPVLVRLGALAYVLYLIHTPLLRFIHVRGVLPLGLGAAFQFLILLAAAIVVVLPLTAALHHAYGAVPERLLAKAAK